MNKAMLIMSAVAGLLNGYGAGRAAKQEMVEKYHSNAWKAFRDYQSLPENQRESFKMFAINKNDPFSQFLSNPRAYQNFEMAKKIKPGSSGNGGLKTRPISKDNESVGGINLPSSDDESIIEDY